MLDFELVRCDQGDRWFPWNYGRKARDGRVGMKQFAHALQSCFTAGSVDGWIIDSEAMCAYTSVRRFLRTLTWHDYDDINGAAQELFVRDLLEEPRGLRRFGALVSPVQPDI